jgi:hypothetical protein
LASFRKISVVQAASLRRVANLPSEPVRKLASFRKVVQAHGLHAAQAMGLRYQTPALP